MLSSGTTRAIAGSGQNRLNQLTHCTSSGAFLRRMYAVFLAIFLFCAACSEKTDVAANKADQLETSDSWSVYEGAWFTIDYPASFEVTQSLESDSKKGYDSVFFESPDGRVKFYVLSPQWGRRATDVAERSDVEFEISRQEHSESGQLLVETVFRANDNSYVRQIEEHYEQGGIVNWAFQITYADEAARETYAAEYLHFKDSLIRYSD